MINELKSLSGRKPDNIYVNNLPITKPWKEMLSEFLSEPTKPNLRQLLQLEAIEDDDLDFKKEFFNESKLAKHIIAMANKRGGVIIFGLDEIEPNIYEPVGIENEIDITDIEKKLNKFIPPELMELKNIVPTSYTESEYEKLKNKTFVSIIIDYDPKYIPFLPLKGGEEIKKDIIYIRKNRATEPAGYAEIQDILNRRLETEYSSSSERKLREHLDELKELYSHITKIERDGYYIKNPSEVQKKFSNTLSAGIIKSFNFGQFETSETYVPPKLNPNYPEEDYENFISRMIKVKKNIIENQISK